MSAFNPTMGPTEYRGDFPPDLQAFSPTIQEFP